MWSEGCGVKGYYEHTIPTNLKESLHGLLQGGKIYP